MKVTHLCLSLCGSMDLYTPWNSPGQNTGVGSHSLLQEIFPTQGSNPGPLHYRQILYQLSHQGSPRILEWVAILFSRRSSRPRDQTWVSCIAGGFSSLSQQGSPLQVDWRAVRGGTGRKVTKDGGGSRQKTEKGCKALGPPV